MCTDISLGWPLKKPTRREGDRYNLANGILSPVSLGLSPVWALILGAYVTCHRWKLWELLELFGSNRRPENIRRETIKTATRINTSVGLSVDRESQGVQGERRPETEAVQVERIGVANVTKALGCHYCPGK